MAPTFVSLQKLNFIVNLIKTPYTLLCHFPLEHFVANIVLAQLNLGVLFLKAVSGTNEISAISKGTSHNLWLS